MGDHPETPETIQKILEVCQESNIFAGTGFLLPLPGTPLSEWAKRHGYRGVDAEYLQRNGDRQDFHVNRNQMSNQEFVTTVGTTIRFLAEKQGLDLQSLFETVKYQRQKNMS